MPIVVLREIDKNSGEFWDYEAHLDTETMKIHIHSLYDGQYDEEGETPLDLLPILEKLGYKKPCPAEMK